MKRTLPLWPVLLLALLLAACSSAPIKDAHTASGDETSPGDLQKTTSFLGNDDLNVVVTLNAHNYDLPVYAVFTAPTGASYATDEIKVDKTVGVVLLGLDWESQGTGSWPVGDWTVDIYVEQIKEKTLEFTVLPMETANP